MENATQIISQYAAGSVKTTISGYYTVGHVRGDFLKEKVRRCFV